MVDIGRTFGALMVGGIVAAIFSGIVTSQAFAYFKNYPDDARVIQILVGVVWILDFCHTIFVSVSLWDHLIAHFGDPERIDFIPWSLAITIAFTALLTFLVHLFFVYRIFRLSHNNFFLGIPLALLACARLSFACLTTVKMITLRSLREFVDLYTWSFTTGLSLSSLLDVLITGLMIYLLKRSHKANSSMNHVLDKLMLYAFENGSLTCAATVTSLLCWITMHTNLIFMGLHFVISKFYANSLLATLNKRKKLKGGHRSQNSVSVERNLAVMFPDNYGLSRKANTTGFLQTEDLRTHPSVRVQVEQTKMSVADDMPSTSSPSAHDTEDVKTDARQLYTSIHDP